MDNIEKLIEPITGAWTTLIVVLIPIAIWASSRVGSWLARTRESPTGSPTSQRYARARLKEALAQVGEAPDDSDEQAQLTARVTEARVLVEAHEARRLTAPTTSAQWWVSTVFLAVFTATTFSIAIQQGRPEVGAVAAAGGVLLVAVQVMAMLTSAVRAERLDVLIAAGRFGHSDRVRTDPWSVLREYDYAKAKVEQRAQRKKRAAVDRSKTNRWIRFERSLIAQRLWRNDVSLSSDIWADYSSPDGDAPRPLPAPAEGDRNVDKRRSGRAGAREKRKR